MRRILTMMTAATAVGLMSLAWPAAERASARQDDGQSQQKSDAKPQTVDRIAEGLRQKGGKVIDQFKADPSTQHQRGKLIRPLVPAGGGGPQAVEEGTFELRVGDMLEIECAAPSDTAASLTFTVEDEEVVMLLPTGVRQLVPVSMIAGEPKPITGMVRYVAIFQAQAEGETQIRLTLGRNQYQYGVKVGAEAGDQ